ncbi:MAG: PIN domain-containing protein [Solirubrobacteraceae bacterium MAG38_C4-C5]|nr:PIN domain-containing protein [Candidatus Siliceabacter maunaloa]
MVALDTNILVYAYRPASPHHEAARRAVRAARDTGAWGLPWPVAHEFVRVVTAAAPTAGKPAPLAAALEEIEGLLSRGGAVALGETPDHWHRLRTIAEMAKASGSRIHDARIAAICLSHGVRELWTADRDFSAFGGLRTRNPLSG